MEGPCPELIFFQCPTGGEAAAHGLSVVFSKKRDCHKLLQQFIQLRIAKGAPLAAEDAGSMALVPHNEDQPQQVGDLSCGVYFRCCLGDGPAGLFQGAKEDHGRLFSIAIFTMIMRLCNWLITVFVYMCLYHPSRMEYGATPTITLSSHPNGPR